MKWFQRKSDGVSARKETQPRAPRSQSLAQVEKLESRLCLGAFDAPDLGDWTPTVPNQNLLPAEVTSVNVADYPPTPDTTDVFGQNTLPGTPQPGQSSAAPPPANTSDNPSLLGDGLNGALGDGSLDPNLAGSSPPSNAVPATMVTDVSPQSPVPLNANSGEFGANTANGAGGSASNTESGGEVENVADVTSNTVSVSGDYADVDGQSHTEVRLPAWWEGLEGPVTVKYDFRDVGPFQNHITDQQKELAVEALDNWSRATGGKLLFAQDTEAELHEIINIGTGELEAFGHHSGEGSSLAVGGGAVTQQSPDGPVTVTGTAWMDVAENWDNVRGNGDVPGKVDFFTVVGHETGHALGLNDSHSFDAQDMMRGWYDTERSEASFDHAIATGTFYTAIEQGDSADATYPMHAMAMVQLGGGEVELLLRRASAATASNDATVAVVDRGGTILGVLVEDGVIANIDDPTNTNTGGDGSGAIDNAEERKALAFFVEGAVAKARTTAFFSAGDPTNRDKFSPFGSVAPLTSRTVRFISQTTITEREVESRATVEAGFDERFRGPGFVAPVGLGGHFPPEVAFTPPVDLFAIEHTNRDHVPLASVVQGGTKNTNNIFFGGINQGDPAAGQILRGGIPFDIIDPTKVDALREPSSFGETTGLDLNARARGIATLPGGIPLYRDTNGDGIGETLVGGIGVFFPGRDGFATFEQNFIPGIGQSEFERINAPKAIEAEYMALAAIGGSVAAGLRGVPGAANIEIAGLPRVHNLDLPFGRIDLVGISLQIVGPIAGRQGFGDVLRRGGADGPGVANGQFIAPDGTFTPVAGTAVGFQDGREVPFGWIVPPRDGINITADEVRQIVEKSIDGANVTRSAVRLRGDTLTGGARTRMIIVVADLNGDILGFFRMQDALADALDVTVAKARNAVYYANPNDLDPADQLSTVGAGVAFTGRTFRFLAEPRYPSGIDGKPGPFSALNNPHINQFTAENIGDPQPLNAYLDTVVGRDSFNLVNPALAGGLGLQTNFNDPFSNPQFDNPNLLNQNGVIFFPGSTPLYRDGVLIGGLGVSGDGVDQNDVVPFIGAQGFLPEQNGVVRADQIVFDDARLPYLKFLRNPFG